METQNSQALVVAQESDLKKSLSLNDPAAITAAPGQDKDLDKQAEEVATRLLNVDPEDSQKRTATAGSVEAMGSELQRKSAKQFEMLKQPVRAMAQSDDKGGSVAKSLVDLKMQVEALDPAKFNFEAGWVSRTLGFIPGLGNPLKRYFSKFESAQTVITAIVKSLEGGRDQLKRDNVSLESDQGTMRDLTKKLEKAVKLGQLIDQKLEAKLKAEVKPEDPRHAFISEELLFPLRQRILDLQTQLAVNQQGVIATELIIRNNKELTRGVDRALNVTVTALNVGATVAIALGNQKAVLDKLDSVNKTTSDLIAGTAARLKTQGTEIQKRASDTQISMDSLKSAFADLKTAMQDLSTFRQQALPKMAEKVLELDRLTGETEKAVKALEEGNKSRPEIKIEVE